MATLREMFGQTLLRHITTRALTPSIQLFMKKVYVYMFICLMIAAFGAVMHLMLDIGGGASTCAMGCCVVFLYITSNRNNSTRFYVLLLAAFLKGVSDGPLIRLVNEYEPRIVVTIYVGGAIPFICFYAAIGISTNRDLSYLCAVVSSSLGIVVWLGLEPLILHGESYSTLQIYMVFLFFVLCLCKESEKLVLAAQVVHADPLYYTVTYCSTIFVEFCVMMLRMVANRHGGKKEFNKEEETMAMNL